MKHIILGTAGHIDHGKSALVESLTGTHPDRWEEEKRRGITIDLGFAFLELGGIRFGFVDVPGHERFVKNMLAGVGGIDLVLLVIAADEGIKPQTREHFDICRLLEIPRGITVLTKSDIADADRLGLLRLEAVEFLRGSFLENAPIVPVSARTGAGLDDLRAELVRVAAQVPAKDSARHFRLPIDRAFAVKGFGTVITGTLVSGSVAPEDEVELFPARRRLRVRGVQSEGKSAQRGLAGQRTAVNLAGIEHTEVARGMVLAAPGCFEATQRMDSRLVLLTSARPLKNHTRVHLHHFASETVAEVVLLDGSALRPGQSAFAQLRLQEPQLCLPGDRFIIRQFSPLATIGGGVVLENLAARHRGADPATLAHLEKLAAGNRETTLAELVTSSRGGLTNAQLIARTGWQASNLRADAETLHAAGKLRLLTAGSEGGFLLVSTARWQDLLSRIRAEIEKFHLANPLLPGVPREGLRKRCETSSAEGGRRTALPAGLFRAALETLVASGDLAPAGDLLRRAGREIELRPEEARAKEQIEKEFARAGLTVPPVKDVLASLSVEPARAQKILQILLREKVLVKISEELIFHRQALAHLRELLAGYKKQKGERISVPAFKELTGVTRKYAIPLLEFLDRERATRRVADERMIL